MGQQLIIPDTILEEMLAYCRQGYPNEVCGILAGKGNEISKIYSITNSENSPDYYVMDSTEQFAVMKDIRKSNLSMIAIYHSHPDAPAYPSQTDVRLAFYDDAVYVIASLVEDGPVVRAFSITGEKIEEVRIVVNGSAECPSGRS